MDGVLCQRAYLLLKQQEEADEEDEVEAWDEGLAFGGASSSSGKRRGDLKRPAVKGTPSSRPGPPPKRLRPTPVQQQDDADDHMHISDGADESVKDMTARASVGEEEEPIALTLPCKYGRKTCPSRGLCVNCRNEEVADTKGTATATAAKATKTKGKGNKRKWI